MKIRIKGNSIRYRLSKTEVGAVLKKGFIDESVDFGNQKLIYALKVNESDDLSAAFIENTITLFIPRHFALQWQDQNKVGFSGVYDKLSLLIEKDFQCLDNTLEDQSDNFPNPALVCG